MAHTGCLELKVKLGWSKRWCNVTLPHEGSGEPARFFRYKAPPPSDFVNCADLVSGVSVEQDARLLRLRHPGAPTSDRGTQTSCRVSRYRRV